MIRRLTDKVYSKIAAGEVIHRPFSAVKELIENSIDAGSKNIEIEIKDGGKKYICINDDGAGMSKEDLEICFHKHTTSKIFNIEDLDTLNTLGFRGEALHSIAAVSKVDISSKNEGSSYGTRIRLEDMTIKKVQPVPMNRGTKIEIKNLFYNMPVRQKFLKSSAAESRSISEVVIRYILSYPEIRFKFVSNNREIFISPGKNDFLDTISVVYGNNYVKNLIPVENKSTDYEIFGFISNLNLYKNNSKFQFLFLNGRYIKNNFISFAVNDAYRNYFREKKYPVFFMNLKVDPSEFDVNIHPTKEEVKFLNERNIFSFIKNSILLTLRQSLEATEISEKEVFTNEKKYNDNGFSYKKDNLISDNKFEQKEFNFERNFSDKNNLYVKNENKDFYNPIFEKKQVESDIRAFRDHRVLGQIKNMYIIVESVKGLLVIDQHVAHERILYEKYQEKINSERVSRQRVLFPLNIELKPYESEILIKKLPLFEKLGFLIEKFGESMFVVKEVPVFLSGLEENIIKSIMDDIFTSSYINEFKDLREEIIINASCKNAIKAGKALSFEEMDLIINELFKTENPYTCPHGRPVILEFGFEDLLKKFGRS